MTNRLRAILLKHWPMILLTVVGVFAYAPLFFGKAFYGEEQSGFYYLISYYVKESIESGMPMTWIPNYYGGVPASFQQFASAWYPLNRVLFAVFNFFTAHHLSMMIATTSGLYLSYWFGRLNNWMRSTSVILALFYLSSTTYIWILIGTTAPHSFAILPGLLVALLFAYRTGKYTLAIMGGGLALGIGFLAGFVQIVFYDYLIAGLYALYLDYERYKVRLPLYKNLAISYTYAAITLLGFIIGFLQFYPSASLIELTIRTDTYATQNASTPNPTEFLAYLLPPYLEIPFFGGGTSHGFYISVIGIVAVILALKYFRSPVFIFFAGVYALMLAFAFHLPGFSWLNEHVPPFSRMGGNMRWSVGAAFPIAFLGAAAIDSILRNPDAISVRVRRFTLYGMAMVTGALALGSLAISALTAYVMNSPEAMSNLVSWYTGGRTLTFPPEHYVSVLSHALQEIATTFSLFNPHFLFGVALWPIATSLLYLLFFKPATRRYLPTAFVAFVTLTLTGTIALQWNTLVPQSLFYEKPELARIISDREQGGEPYRIMGYLIGDGSFLQTRNQKKHSAVEATSIQFQTMSNNINLYFGIDRMDGMEPYRTLRHNQLLNTVIAHDWAAWTFDDLSPVLTTSALDQLYNRDVQKQVPLGEKLSDFPKRLPLISMMNVKYVYSPFPLEGMEEIAVVPVYRDIGLAFSLYVYENPNVLPRVFSAPVTYASSEREAFLGVIANTDFARQSWIECTDCENLPPAQTEITIDHYGAGIIEFGVQSDAPAWIIVSESYFPGWRAAINGNETSIYRANYLFQAIRVPAGDSHVQMRYEDVAVGFLKSIFGQQ